MGTVPTQLAFLRITDDALLFSKLPNTSEAECTRVVPLRDLRSVVPLSRHSFELRAVAATSPAVSVIRLQTHDAYSCKQWVLRLRATIATIDTSHSFPSRPVSSALPPSPRSPPTKSHKDAPLAEPNLNVTVALSRGWHVNTGQHGLQRLRALSPRT